MCSAIPFPRRRRAKKPRATASRSEEHTSELQSHSDLVCRLLLEKKKKNEKTRDNVREWESEHLQPQSHVRYLSSDAPLRSDNDSELLMSPSVVCDGAAYELRLDQI